LCFTSFLMYVYFVLCFHPYFLFIALFLYLLLYSFCVLLLFLCMFILFFVFIPIFYFLLFFFLFYYFIKFYENTVKISYISHYLSSLKVSSGCNSLYFCFRSLYFLSKISNFHSRSFNCTAVVSMVLFVPVVSFPS